MSTEVLESREAVWACVFSLGGETFALDVKSVSEVVVFDERTPVPRAPAHVLGVANLRGKVLAVVDARPLLGLPAERRGRAVKGLVVKAAGWQVALVVDGVLGLEPFEEVLPLGEASRRRLRRLGLGLLARGDSFATLLDGGVLLKALRGGRERAAAETSGEARAGSTAEHAAT